MGRKRRMLNLEGGSPGMGSEWRLQRNAISTDWRCHSPLHVSIFLTCERLCRALVFMYVFLPRVAPSLKTHVWLDHAPY